VADKVDEGLHDYRDRHGIAEVWETKERVVVALTGSPQGEHLVRRAARMAGRARAELVGVHIRAVDGLIQAEGHLLDHQRGLLVEVGGRYEEITGSDIAKALVEFARAENATQLVLGATKRSRWGELVHGSIINQVLRAAGDIDVHVISNRAGDGGGDMGSGGALPRLPRRGRLAPLPRRRVGAGWAMALAGVPLLALVMVPFRTTLTVEGALPIVLVGCIAVAAVGGVWPGLVGAVVGFLVADWLFIPPIHTLTISRARDAAAGITFLLMAVSVSLLVDLAARRRLEAARAQGESEALARLAGGALVSRPEAMPSLLAELRATFGLDAVAILMPRDQPSGPAAGGGGQPAPGADSGQRAREDGRGRRNWQVQAASGAPVPESPADAQFSAELGGGAVLVLAGSQLAADDRRLLSAFVAQLRLAREQGRLLAQAASAEQLSETNELRTALLAAVSHDLRTPLASIKASATSLLSDEVSWAPDAVKGFCRTINEETDRLNTLVGNLLDMSRLQTGVLHLTLRPVGLEEVVFAALGSLSRDASRIVVDVPESLPRITADAALLERAVANLIDNALNWSPPDQVLRVEAGRYGDRIDFRVVDRGPGIPPDQRDAVFQPFQRLGDGGGAAKDGVGLGLAVAKGFVEAMGGELVLEDTPGGGLTSVISLPVVGGEATARPAAQPAGDDAEEELAAQ